MKNIILKLSLLVVLVVLVKSIAFAQTENASKPFRHIVIITFKPGASPDSIKALDHVYQDLAKSPFVKDFEWGVNVSARDPNTLKHVYNTTFASEEEMKSYAKIPEYKRLFQLSLPIADDVTVADYTINK
jgi:hypothetical protein